jgi:NodT family efflux transporter outer membrane factor (OMF) lipoprotein
MRAIHLSLAVLTLALPADRAVGQDHKQPAVALTSSFIGGNAIVAATTPDTWWRAFNDPILNRAVERALKQNLDLAQVQARVVQARAAARLAGANLMPTANASGSAEGVHSSLKSPLGEIAHGVGAARDYSDYSLGALATWEIDLFGGLRHSRDAAIGDERATEASAGAMRVSIAAEVADAYITLRGLQARLAVAEDQEQTQAKLVELVQRRFDEGVSSDRELQRAIGAMEGVRASSPPLRAAIDGQLNRIDVLMGAQAGTYRAEFLSPVAVPMAPTPSGSLMPADLLRRRPDVVAAEHRLTASDARIGAAIAEYYPRFSIGGALGYASLGASNLFGADALQAQGIAGLRWRLFDFGRIDAEVAIARSRDAEALSAYRSAILEATADVESALSQLTQREMETRILERQITALRAAREQTHLAYQNGVVALIDVLDADRELLAASDRHVAAESEEARASVAAFRALGGGWNN